MSEDDTSTDVAGDPTSAAKRPDYEQLVEAVNEDVASLELPDVSGVDGPVLLVAGLPRSGSTLLMQALAETGLFGYPTNLIARFYRNPHFGVRLQRLVEPLLERGSMSFESYRGRTSNWYEPHEFGYFWEWHLPFEHHHEPSREALDAVDWEALGTHARAMVAAFGRPVVFKNLLLSFVLEELDAALPDARFVEIHRRPEEVANSLYRSRVADFGDAESWFSIRPANADELERRYDPPEQIARQMVQVEEAVRRAAETVDDERWIRVNYRDLCEDPAREVQRIASSWELGEPDGLEELRASFEPSGVRELPGDAQAQMEKLLADFGFHEL